MMPVSLRAYVCMALFERQSIKPVINGVIFSTPSKNEIRKSVDIFHVCRRQSRHTPKKLAVGQSESQFYVSCKILVKINVCQKRTYLQSA